MTVSLDLRQRHERALNRLAKWRSVFASWQLGTRRSDDPECQAVRDARELLLMIRVEVNALTKCCFDKGVFTREQFLTQILDECEHTQQQLEQRFPGFTATDEGMSIDVAQAAATMKGLRRR